MMAVTFRFLTEPTAGRTNAEGWLGFQKNESELGLIVGYVDEMTTEDDSVLFGGFTAYHFPDLRTVIENVLFPAEWLPAQLTASPSVGLAIVYNPDTGNLRTSPFLGLKVYNTLEIQIAYDTFSEDSESPDGTRIGISSSWKF
jgi:hypothetical protein